jgi:hypothetical protein
MQLPNVTPSPADQSAGCEDLERVVGGDAGLQRLNRSRKVRARLAELKLRQTAEKILPRHYQIDK